MPQVRNKINNNKNENNNNNNAEKVFRDEKREGWVESEKITKIFKIC